MFDINRFEEIKDEFESNKSEIERKKGELDQLMNRLKEESGVETVEQAQKIVDDLKNENAKIEPVLEKKMNELEEEWEAFENE